MNSKQKNFIEMIGNMAVLNYGRYCILPSLVIAQAILESGWGQSQLSRECYNYFGMKWISGCGCKCKVYQTKEEKTSGEIVSIQAKFRQYDSAAAGIQGYYDFLQYGRYSNLKNEMNYAKACELIQKDGWATSSSYAANLKRLIENYQLTDWDKKVLNGNSVEAAQTQENTNDFVTGTYRVTASALKVRSGPGINYGQKKFSEMTSSAQSQNSIYQGSGLAYYKNGIQFSAQQVIKNAEHEFWAKTPSGYVAMEYEGAVYVEKC